MNTIIKFLVIGIVFVLFGCGTNWNENLNEGSKDPFGLYIVKNELKTLFDVELKSLDRNICEEIVALEKSDSSLKVNYICINNSSKTFTSCGLERVKDFVKKGNNIFISLNNFPDNVKSTFGIDSNFDKLTGFSLKSASGKLSFVNKKLSPSEFYYKRNLRKSYFEFTQNSNLVVLGSSEFKDQKQANFIRINYGKGSVFLHHNPIAFTNYYMLDDKTQSYVASVFSYMTDCDVIWWDGLRHKSYSQECCKAKKSNDLLDDELSNEATRTDNSDEELNSDGEYLEDENEKYREAEKESEEGNSSKEEADDVGEEYEKECEGSKNDSIFKFFWEHPSLKWSLLVALFGFIAFMIFNVRRRQRVIPEIPKLKNLTVEFTHTIANLYLEEGNPKNLVDKKIVFFFHKIRTKYRISTTKLDEVFIASLSLKSGNSYAKTEHLITQVNNLNNAKMCSENDLIMLNAGIDDFFKEENKK